MNPRYERNIPALTEAECALLRGKRVLVVDDVIWWWVAAALADI